MHGTHEATSSRLLDGCKTSYNSEMSKTQPSCAIAEITKYNKNHICSKKISIFRIKPGPSFLSGTQLQLCAAYNDIPQQYDITAFLK